MDIQFGQQVFGLRFHAFPVNRPKEAEFSGGRMAHKDIFSHRQFRI